MLRTRTLPRLSASTVRRPRLERWLASHQNVPLRLLVAPAGNGKTTLLLKYIPNSTIQSAYCSIPPECPPSGLFGAMAAALALPAAPSSYESLIDALRKIAVEPLEVVVDDVDNGQPETIAILRRLIEDAPETIGFIYTSRSREAIDAKNWVSRGLAVLCDARRLAFDSAETELLAEACGVPYTHVELGRLLEESDGWAIVVSGAIRSAAEDSRSLHDAFENWRTRYGQVFTEFIAADLERVREEDRALMRSIIAGATFDDQHRLQRLEAQGLFVINDGGSYRPYRPLRRIHGPRARLSVNAQFAPMIVQMFGRFEASINGQEVRWMRRRDQQLIKYLLLKPDGHATRAEIASVFWPGADKHLAAQSLRTACSNIRKAIAGAVGYACVDLYFRADPDVSLDLSNVVADVRRFTAHFNDGESAYQRGEIQEAAIHYRAAEELYNGKLLEGDVPEPWFVSQAQELGDHYLVILERLAEAAFEEGDMKEAGSYAFQAQKIRPQSPRALQMLSQVASQFHSGGSQSVVTPIVRRQRPSA